MALHCGRYHSAIQTHTIHIHVSDAVVLLSSRIQLYELNINLVFAVHICCFFFFAELPVIMTALTTQAIHPARSLLFVWLDNGTAEWSG